MTLSSHRPSRSRYDLQLRYLKAWAAVLTALALLITAITGLLATLGI